MSASAMFCVSASVLLLCVIGCAFNLGIEMERRRVVNTTERCRRCGCPLLAAFLRRCRCACHGVAA